MEKIEKIERVESKEFTRVAKEEVEQLFGVEATLFLGALGAVKMGDAEFYKKVRDNKIVGLFIKSRSGRTLYYSDVESISKAQKENFLPAQENRKVNPAEMDSISWLEDETIWELFAQVKEGKLNLYETKDEYRIVSPENKTLLYVDIGLMKKAGQDDIWSRSKGKSRA